MKNAKAVKQAHPEVDALLRADRAGVAEFLDREHAEIAAYKF